ncbi:uncharacterized protein BJ212DRAFT_1480271 [Suillus subaureus]|uniref:Uncharacterized protein n=1 Tax=Suillus subaureus TaxID=48587 RepID=A0A9P7ECF0_9AGAM|nr:uncharacterized protein BJ212DRAFT_1480271 [Suillus subaureus]KAG1817727.1 hypothetical protein BJ212DRAFT_1480271 [Suillus subaureus]
MSYFTPASNSNVSNRRGHSQVPSHHTSLSLPSSSGGYAQPPPPTRGGFIPPPVGAMQPSGQTVLDCPRCHEILPPGLDLATHFIGCGAAELLTKAFTPFHYPSRPNHTGGQPPNSQLPPPNYNGRSGSRR